MIRRLGVFLFTTAEDRTAVAKAIDERLTEIGLNQRELAERSHIVLSIVREIRNNTVQRRRSRRTLEALSAVLGWHPRHPSTEVRITDLT